MLKKSLIATALVFSTWGAFAQAPATPGTSATAATPAPAAAPTKTKHAAAKVKRTKLKAKRAAANGAAPSKPAASAKP
jgi:hypothetical protein